MTILKFMRVAKSESPKSQAVNKRVENSRSEGSGRKPGGSQNICEHPIHVRTLKQPTCEQWTDRTSLTALPSPQSAMLQGLGGRALTSFARTLVPSLSTPHLSFMQSPGTCMLSSSFSM